MALVHKHLIIRAEVNKPPTNPIFIEAWLLDVVSAIGMKVCKGPIAHYVDMPGNRGVTGVVIIETSHIALHVWDETRPSLFQLDVYSCKEFNKQTVFEKLAQFEPVDVEWYMLDRTDRLSFIGGETKA